MLIASLVTVAVVTCYSFFHHYYRFRTGIDDAYITYHYARNIAEGHGWVYNLGEHIQGASTPLFTLWLSALASLGLPIPTASIATAFVATMFTTILMFLWLRHLGSSFAGFCGVAFLLKSNYMYAAISGMETVVYIALTLAAFYFFFLEQPYTTLAVAGLCMLTRLDGIIVLGVLAAAQWWRDKELPWRQLIAPVFLNLAWFTFAWSYFGSPLPNSFLAKQFHTGHAFLTWMPQEAIGFSPTFWFLAVAGLIVQIVQRWVAPREHTLPLERVALAIWLALYVAAYTMSKLDEYPWYAVPMIAGICFLAASGIGSLLSSIVTLDRAQRIATRFGIAIAVMPALFFQATRSPYYSPEVEDARYAGAKYASLHVPKDAVIEAAGIGMIGWFTNNPMLDAAGLISPQVLEHYPQPWLINSLSSTAVKYQPGYVFDASLVSVGWPATLRANYHPVKSFPHGHPLFTPFVLWQRNN